MTNREIKPMFQPNLRLSRRDFVRLSAAGVLSGGIFMYVSPLVDKAIKPTKPLANFAVETKGRALD